MWLCIGSSTRGANLGPLGSSLPCCRCLPPGHSATNDRLDAVATTVAAPRRSLDDSPWRLLLLIVVAKGLHRWGR